MDPNDEFVKRATAHQRGGAGQHNDKRDKRRRTRNAARQAAIKEEKNG